MNITVPLYVEEQPPSFDGAAHTHAFLVRPLFFDRPREEDESVQRATTRLARELRRTLTTLAHQGRHEEFAAYTFYPPLEEQLLKLPLDVGNRRFRVRHLFITLPAFGRRFASTPNLPEVWFEIARGETLADRAREVFTEHYRALERKYGSERVRPELTSLSGKAWLSAVEVSIDVPVVYTPPVPNLFAILGASETPDGAAELERVGYSLNALHPEGLDRATNREREVEEVSRLIAANDLRPVLLVGRRLVGKTTIIHECVRARMERRRASEQNLPVRAQGGISDLAGDIWLIAPQRLISGMTYVGQWENRLLAILKEVERKRHTIYFDDLVGLFHAGRSSNSSLSVAHVLKPYIERRQVRVIAEATPEIFRVLQELDRSFIDLFQVVHIDEPNERDTTRTLLGFRRTLERAHRCRFEMDVLPLVIDLTRRYESDAAFPGKAARLLRTVATKRKASNATRADVLTEFAAKSGLSVGFLDDRAHLDHAEVIEALSREVIGQRTGVAACADAVTIAKARLNDTTRPLASFLFLGPTGVGKTQMAKSLAKYLFGDAERLLRFDMNEFVTSYAVARLVGTFDAPEGLLTSAVRREPFSVVLFDEIEKAHPAIFDLLLGVMGDARLTDARGRTVNFTNTIIILTSNLGVREAARDLGFRQTNHSDASVYRQAAEKFFKPEFFNRLTRVVPFERLRREDVRRIARSLIEDVFKRDGLVRRGVKLIVEEDALDHLVDAGFHPQLGARALKRTLERFVTAPIAARLAAAVPDQPLIITLHARDGNIAVVAQGLTLVKEDAAPLMQVRLEDADDLLDCIEDALVRIEGAAEELRPPGEIIITGDDARTAVHLRHFLVRDQARRVSRMLERADERLARERFTHESQSQTARGTQNTQQTIRPRSVHGAAGRMSSSGRTTNKTANRRQLAKLPQSSATTFKSAASHDSSDATTSTRDQQSAPFVFDNALLLAQNLHRVTQDAATVAVPYGEDIADYLQDILRETALLDAMLKTITKSSSDNSHDPLDAAPLMRHNAQSSVRVSNDTPPRVLLSIASFEEKGLGPGARLRDLYRMLFEREFNCRVQPFDDSTSAARQAHLSSLRHAHAIILDGELASVLAPLEAGTHLFVSPGESYVPVVVSARVLADFDAHTNASGGKDDSSRLPPVLRIYSEPNATLDLRSRLLATGKLGAAELRAFLLSALPPPLEFKSKHTTLRT